MQRAFSSPRIEVKARFTSSLSTPRSSPLGCVSLLRRREASANPLQYEAFLSNGVVENLLQRNSIRSSKRCILRVSFTVNSPSTSSTALSESSPRSKGVRSSRDKKSSEIAFMWASNDANPRSSEAWRKAFFPASLSPDFSKNLFASSKRSSANCESAATRQPSFLRFELLVPPA